MRLLGEEWAIAYPDVFKGRSWVPIEPYCCICGAIAITCSEDHLYPTLTQGVVLSVIATGP